MKNITKIISYIIVLELMVVMVFAYGANITLAWDSNTEPEVIGYNIYWKNHINEEYDSSRMYEIFETDMINPLFPQITIYGLNESMTYYFVATAFTDLYESGYSNEAIWTYQSDISPNFNPPSSSGGGGCFINTIK